MSRLRLALVFHDHQPIGNFDGVFEGAYQDSYLQLLDVLRDYPDLPMVLHTSGSLLEWIVANHPEYIDLVRGFVERGKSQIAQDHTLMPGTAFLTVGIDANLERVHADLARDIHDIVWMKLSRKEFVPRLEVAGRY